MEKIDFKKIFKSVKASAIKHSPEILTGVGIAGMITATVLAVKATPRAIELIEEERDLREIDRANGVDERFASDNISFKDKVKLTWKCYIPAAATTAMSVSCLIGASAVNLRRNAALATAYSLSETALKEYKEKVMETVGPKKERAIQDKVAEEKIANNPVSKNEVIITEKGNTLCYDSISDRYFNSDIEKIRKTVNTLNAQMITGQEECVSLNEFYDELGLRHTTTGDDLGWNVASGLIDIDFSSHITDDGRPCLVINYSVAPKYNFYKLS